MDNPEVITETEGGPMVVGLTVQLVVSNFDLRPPTESCQGSETCGHIHLVITSPDRNNQAASTTCDVPGHPYNTAGSDLQQTVTFATCVLSLPMADPPFENHGVVFGPHAITAELHLENHTAAPGAVSDTIFVVVMP
jgi:hypothetical protein